MTDFIFYSFVIKPVIHYYEIFINGTSKYTLRRKGYISATHLEPLKSSIEPFRVLCNQEKGSLWNLMCSFIIICFVLSGLNISYYWQPSKPQNVFMNACEWSQIYVVNQYHTKSAISVFLLQKSAWLKCYIKLLQQFNKQ